MSITNEIHRLHQELPSTTKLVAVSKFHPAEAIEEAYAAGQRIFGESRVQELCEKRPLLPQDIEWHFIGHLQTNKIKQIVPFVSLIHGVDSAKLLGEINKEGEKIGRVVPCLLQLFVAQEETKFGLSPSECRDLVDKRDQYPYVQLCGLMGMASLTENQTQIRSEFKLLKSLFDELRLKLNTPYFKELSMGMSQDYALAVECGSTMVRIGSRIFGFRQY
ncbi:MAG TPA: YggS family pyridoxal phosphate-dependent enzyme [Bacteroidales bacterium]|nr:YggS family pyridoxal phosphate-dependent enzyme [Bacteroidales bacterium]